MQSEDLVTAKNTIDGNQSVTESRCVAIYNQLRRRKLTVRQTVVVAIADCLSVMSGVIQKRVDGCGYVALLCPCSLFFPMKRDEER